MQIDTERLTQTVDGPFVYQYKYTFFYFEVDECGTNRHINAEQVAAGTRVDRNVVSFCLPLLNVIPFHQESKLCTTFSISVPLECSIYQSD